MTTNPSDRPTKRLFECLDCGRRVETDYQPITCAACGGDLRDISLPREQ